MFTRVSLILGIVYLTFEVFPIIFQRQHGFNEQMTGLSFCGLGFGEPLVMLDTIQFRTYSTNRSDSWTWHAAILGPVKFKLHT
jgi:hypothetical protein